MTQLLAAAVLLLSAAQPAAAQSPKFARSRTRAPAAPRVASISAEAGATGAGRSRPVAAAGYCVVRLRDHREWTLGELAAGGVFDDREYRFASTRERDIFAAAPERYAPVLGGDCIVTFAATGQRVAGRLEFGLVHSGHVYLFATAEHRTEFQADPARFADADLIDGGRCPVSRVDRQRTVAGIPATTTLHNGLRFQFASAHDRAVFLEHPERYEVVDAKTRVPSAEPLPLATAPVPPAAAGAPPADPAAAGRGAAKGGGAPGASGGLELEKPPVLGGFCPVTIQQSGLWVRGRYDHRVELDGVLLLAAGPKQRKALEDDLARYMPALGGDCTVSFVENNGARLAGSPFQSVLFRGRLFLFVDAEHRATFKSDPAKYANVDVAAGGMCVVTQQEHGRTEPGLAEHAAWFRGHYYQFVGAEQKAMFLASPEKYATP